jgi:hypothetical protein
MSNSFNTDNDYVTNFTNTLASENTPITPSPEPVSAYEQALQEKNAYSLQDQVDLYGNIEGLLGTSQEGRLANLEARKKAKLERIGNKSQYGNLSDSYTELDNGVIESNANKIWNNLSGAEYTSIYDYAVNNLGLGQDDQGYYYKATGDRYMGPVRRSYGYGTKGDDETYKFGVARGDRPTSDSRYTDYETGEYGVDINKKYHDILLPEYIANTLEGLGHGREEALKGRAVPDSFDFENYDKFGSGATEYYKSKSAFFGDPTAENYGTAFNAEKAREVLYDYATKYTQPNKYYKGAYSDDDYIDSFYQKIADEVAQERFENQTFIDEVAQTAAAIPAGIAKGALDLIDVAFEAATYVPQAVARGITGDKTLDIDIFDDGFKKAVIDSIDSALGYERSLDELQLQKATQELEEAGIDITSWESIKETFSNEEKRSKLGSAAWRLLTDPSLTASMITEVVGSGGALGGLAKTGGKLLSKAAPKAEKVISKVFRSNIDKIKDDLAAAVTAKDMAKVKKLQDSYTLGKRIPDLLRGSVYTNADMAVRMNNDITTFKENNNGEDPSLDKLAQIAVLNRIVSTAEVMSLKSLVGMKNSPPKVLKEAAKTGLVRAAGETVGKILVGGATEALQETVDSVVEQINQKVDSADFKDKTITEVLSDASAEILTGTLAGAGSGVQLGGLSASDTLVGKAVPKAVKALASLSPTKVKDTSPDSEEEVQTRSRAVAEMRAVAEASTAPTADGAPTNPLVKYFASQGSFNEEIAEAAKQEVKKAEDDLRSNTHQVFQSDKTPLEKVKEFAPTIQAIIAENPKITEDEIINLVINAAKVTTEEDTAEATKVISDNFSAGQEYASIKPLFEVAKEVESGPRGFLTYFTSAKFALAQGDIKKYGEQLEKLDSFYNYQVGKLDNLNTGVEQVRTDLNKEANTLVASGKAKNVRDGLKQLVSKYQDGSKSIEVPYGSNPNSDTAEIKYKTVLQGELYPSKATTGIYSLINNVEREVSAMRKVYNVLTGNPNTSKVDVATTPVSAPSPTPIVDDGENSRSVAGLNKLRQDFIDNKPVNLKQFIDEYIDVARSSKTTSTSFINEVVKNKVLKSYSDLPVIFNDRNDNVAFVGTTGRGTDDFKIRALALGTILRDPEAVKNGAAEYNISKEEYVNTVVAHELIHIATLDSAEKDPKFKQELTKVSKRLQVYLDSPASDNLTTLERSRIQKMVNSPVEVPTIVLTEPGIQEVLKTIPYENESVFDQFVNIVLDLMNIKASDKNLLVKAIEVSVNGLNDSSAVPTTDVAADTVVDEEITLPPSEPSNIVPDDITIEDEEVALPPSEPTNAIVVDEDYSAPSEDIEVMVPENVVTDEDYSMPSDEFSMPSEDGPPVMDEGYYMSQEEDDMYMYDTSDEGTPTPKAKASKNTIVKEFSDNSKKLKALKATLRDLKATLLNEGYTKEQVALHPDVVALVEQQSDIEKALDANTSVLTESSNERLALYGSNKNPKFELYAEFSGSTMTKVKKAVKDIFKVFVPTGYTLFKRTEDDLQESTKRFIESLEKNQGALSSKALNLFRSLDDNPASFLLYNADNTYNINTVEAMQSAAYEFLVQDLSKLAAPDFTIEDIAKMFNIEQESITPDLEYAVKDGAVTFRLAAEAIGSKALDNLGLKIDNIKDRDAMITSLGLSALQGIKGDLVESFTYKGVELNNETQLLRAAPGIFSKLDSIKNTIKYFEDTLGVEVDRFKSYRKSPTAGERTVKIHRLPFQNAPKDHQKAVNTLEKTGFAFNSGNKVLFEMFKGEDGNLDVDALIVHLIGKETKGVNRYDEEVYAAKKQALQRDLKFYQEAMEDVGDGELFFNWFISRDHRIHLDSTTINPQTDKDLARWLLTASTSKHQIAKADIDAILDGKATKDLNAIMFAYSIVQAFDGSIPISIDKNNEQEVLKEAARLLRDVSTADLMAMAKKSAHVGHAALAISNIQKYMNNEIIDSDMVLEVDGLTNGFAFRILQFPLVPEGSALTAREWAEKVGFIKEESELYDLESMNEARDAGSEDVYISVGTEFGTHIASKVAGVKGLNRKWVSFLQDKSYLPDFTDTDNGDVKSFIRNLMKSPVMIFNYAAGMGKITESLVDDHIRGKNYMSKQGLLTKLTARDDNGNFEISAEELKKAFGKKGEVYHRARIALGKELISFKGNKDINELRKDLYGAMTELYADPLETTLTNLFGAQTAVNAAVTNASTFMFNKFKDEYNIWLNNNPNATNDDKNAFLKQMVFTIPGIKSASSTSQMDKITFLRNVLEESTQSVRVPVIGGYDSTKTVSRTFGDPGVAAAVLTILSLDSSTLARTINDGKNGILVVHDALVVGIGQHSYIGGYSKNFYNINRSYSVTEEFVNAINGFSAKYPEMMYDTITDLKGNPISFLDMKSGLEGINDMVQEQRKIMFAGTTKVGQMVGPRGTTYEANQETDKEIAVKQMSAMSSTILNTFNKKEVKDALKDKHAVYLKKLEKLLEGCK